jgi:hypothetical protein
MVTFCPNDKGEQLSCESTIDGTTRPEDIVIVSSRDGLAVFWNEDCARCHGITDIIRQLVFLIIWNISFLNKLLPLNILIL